MVGGQILRQLVNFRPCRNNNWNRSILWVVRSLYQNSGWQSHCVYIVSISNTISDLRGQFLKLQTFIPLMMTTAVPSSVMVAYLLGFLYIGHLGRFGKATRGFPAHFSVREDNYRKSTSKSVLSFSLVNLWNLINLIVRTKANQCCLFQLDVSVLKWRLR